MATTVNMHEAKTQLSKLVERAEAGEEIVIARAGKPAARLVALEKREPRQFGGWRGKVPPPDDVHAGDDEIREMFEKSMNEPLFPR